MLEQKDLLGALRSAARAKAFDPVLVDQINAFRKVTNFDKVLDNLLRAKIAPFREGAAFHLNFAWSKYKAAGGGPRFLDEMVFETECLRFYGKLTQLERAVDITIGGTRSELKSAKRVYEYFVQGKDPKKFAQMQKDIYDALGRAASAKEVLQEMQKTVWVFDSVKMARAGLKEADVIVEFQKMLCSWEFVAGDVARGMKAHPLMPQIIENVGKSIKFWP